MIDWLWVGDHLGALAYRFAQHVYLAALAVLVGLVISFALAIWAVRRRGVYPPISVLATVVYTIPSLALFAAFVPITAFSILTPEIPLVLYTFVILIRNIVAGFTSVPADVLEAADGMGYRGNERLWRVELPLAVPLIVAGLRLASVSTIGLVTITATISDAYGGLGFFIVEGYHRSFPTEILTGAIPSIVLAVAVDAVFVRLQRQITPWTARPAGAGT